MMMIIIIMSMGVGLCLWTAATNGRIRSSPRWNMIMGNHSVTMMSTEGNSWFLRQSFPEIVPADSSGSKREEWAKWRKIWPYKVLFSYLQVISAYRKILRHGAIVFTSPPKEGVLRIFIGLKNLSPRPALNPQTLGPIANTPNITLPWRLLKRLRKFPAVYGSRRFITMLTRNCQRFLSWRRAIQCIPCIFNIDLNSLPSTLRFPSDLKHSGSPYAFLVIEYRCRVVNTPTSCSGCPVFKSGLVDRLFLVLVVFLSLSRQIPRKYLKIRSPPLPSKSCRILHSLVTLSFDAVQFKLLNKRC
jgi:hypothetical protein